MNLSRESQSRLEESELRRLARVKARQAATTEPLGAGAGELFQAIGAKAAKEAGKDRRRLGDARAGGAQQACALEGLHKGSLTVLVDSSSHIYELKHLLIAGLEKQLLLACRSAGLSKIVLRAGSWYDDRREARF